jgi:hypothetical protein
MKRFFEGEDRFQSTLSLEHLDDYIAEDNPVRVVDVFVDELDLNELGFEAACSSKDQKRLTAKRNNVVAT